MILSQNRYNGLGDGFLPIANLVIRRHRPGVWYTTELRGLLCNSAGGGSLQVAAAECWTCPSIFLDRCKQRLSAQKTQDGVIMLVMQFCIHRRLKAHVSYSE